MSGRTHGRTGRAMNTNLSSLDQILWVVSLDQNNDMVKASKQANKQTTSGDMSVGTVAHIRTSEGGGVGHYHEGL